MSGPAPAAGMGWLVDAHTSGEGYLGSPRDGTLATVVAAVQALEAEFNVRAGRRLGVSLEYVLAARELGITFAWGSPWVEERASGPRNSIPAGQVSEQLLRGLSDLGLDTLCLGSTCGVDTLRRLLPLAADLGLEVAAAPSSALVQTLDRGTVTGVVTLESLADLSVSVHLAAQGHDQLPSTAETLAAVGAWGTGEVGRVTERIQWWGLRVTPLLVATWRRASLVNAVNAPVLDRASRALPYHQRLASLRAPGALRMGGRDAARHLGISVLRGEESKRVAQGYDRLQSILEQLIKAGHPLSGGSGAPGVGLCSGYAAREEFDLWSSLSDASDRISAAFGRTPTPAVLHDQRGDRVDA